MLIFLLFQGGEAHLALALISYAHISKRRTAILGDILFVGAEDELECGCLGDVTRLLTARGFPR